MQPGPTTRWSTAAVDGAEAFDYWRDLICDTFVQLSARPLSDEAFRGRIEYRDARGLQLSTVNAGAQRVDRTRSLIARGHEEFVLASVQLAGRGVVRQDGRAAVLAPGSMAFYDSTRPYTLEFDAPFRQLVVQVPRRSLTRARVADATAVTLPGSGPGRLVGEFLVGLTREGGAHVDGLVPHAVGLLDFALGLMVGAAADPGVAAVREAVHRVVRAGADDPGTDADSVAAACRISRRTLFRVLAEHDESFTGLLRAERVRRAAALLRARPDLPVAAVAARCGFGGEAQLHRTFRRETGMTPGAWRSGTDRQEPWHERSPTAAVARPSSIR